MMMMMKKKEMLFQECQPEFLQFLFFVRMFDVLDHSVAESGMQSEKAVLSPLRFVADQSMFGRWLHSVFFEIPIPGMMIPGDCPAMRSWFALLLPWRCWAEVHTGAWEVCIFVG